MAEACGQGQSVRTILSRNPVTVQPDVTLTSAWELMKGNHIRHLPVVDDDGVLVGLLSDRDILAVMGLKGAGSHSVGEVMQTEVDVIDPDCCLQAAARFILHSKRSSLPVLDEDGRVLGIVTESDFLLYLVQDSEACACESWKVL